ncbi:Protein MAIN-LIKE 2 [Glycine soja]
MHDMQIMVRTRGLGRALGRSIGKGRGGQDEHHADDVPRRRRSTVSVRRQRVHVSVAEDVADMTEDVPQMTEDVPPMTTDVPAAGVEGLANDVATGSVANHAKGFLGGPRDPSVLTSFAEHVANNIWTGEEARKFGRTALEIVGLIAATGLTPLIGCSVVTDDPRVLSAFMERWHRETSTFLWKQCLQRGYIYLGLTENKRGYISCGSVLVEGTSTRFKENKGGYIPCGSLLVKGFLQGHSIQHLHLLVGEATITLNDVVSLLHLPITSTFHNFEPLVVDEVVVLLIELLKVLGEEARAEIVQAHGAYVRLWIVVANAYLLHLVGCTFFANKSATHVHVVHLEAFRDLSESGSYAWGAAALCWIYEHFPSVHDCVTDDTYDKTSPRACRWLMTKAYIKGLPAAPYQTRLDALTITDVCWMPYGGASLDGVLLWSQFNQRRWYDSSATFRPSPVSASLSYEDIDDQWMHYSDHLAIAGEIFVVLGQHEEYIELGIPEVQVGEGGGPSKASDPPRHVVDAYEGCEAIREILERVLNLRMVIEGTELHDFMEDCLRIARGDNSDGNVRAR